MMRAGIWGVSTLLVLLMLQPAAVRAEPDSNRFRNVWRNYKKARGGCFLLYDVQRKRLVINEGGASCRKRRTPCSTFKIVNSLIGLQTGVLTGPKQTFRWDGKKRMISDWNRDQTLASAIRYSAVWVFKRVARTIGQKRMKRWIDRLGYGNRDISGGLDRFWLRSTLLISPLEQLELIKRLYAGRLPVKPTIQQTVRGMLLYRKRKDVALYGKTGSGMGSHGRVTIGWFVGWVQLKKSPYLLVAMLHGPGAENGWGVRRYLWRMFSNRKRCDP